jgi:hypothetical protein
MHNYHFIDIHYHANPDLYRRRWNAFDAGRHYKSMGGAVVLTSHLGATTVQATLAQQEGLPVFPSIVLNAVAGGIDYRVVLRALAEYQPVIPSNVIVHFPTITGRAYHSRLERKLVNEALQAYTQKAETLFGDYQRLRKEVLDILAMSRDYPIVLSTGHASKDEVYALVDACETYDVSMLLLNQPANPLTGFSASELLHLTQQKSVWVEQTALTYLLGYQSKEDFAQVLKEVPRVIYSSDLGQTSQMDSQEWHTASINYFNEFKLPAERQNDIWLKNPKALLMLTA